jgi:hypothetical protein
MYSEMKELVDRQKAQSNRIRGNENYITMKRSLFTVLLISLNYLTYAQVQKWETWQDNFYISNGTALSAPNTRNVSMNLWVDRGFGAELHFRNNTWGTALYTRASNEAIWLGNYNPFTNEQQSFNPWMTLVNGRVGIGTTNPATKLAIAADANFSTNGWLSGQLQLGGATNTNKFLSLGFSTANNYGFIQAGESGVAYRDLILNPSGSGNVGIGTTNPREKLSVNGTLVARMVKITIKPEDWSDYVFAKNYKLRSLTTVKTYINKYKHLPDVPSAKKVAKEGLNVAAIQAALLRKIEELTLYVIEQDTRNQSLQKRIELLESNQTKH